MHCAQMDIMQQTVCQTTSCANAVPRLNLAVRRSILDVTIPVVLMEMISALAEIFFIIATPKECTHKREERVFPHSPSSVHGVEKFARHGGAKSTITRH